MRGKTLRQDCEGLIREMILASAQKGKGVMYKGHLSDGREESRKGGVDQWRKVREDQNNKGVKV